MVRERGMAFSFLWCVEVSVGFPPSRLLPYGRPGELTGHVVERLMTIVWA